MSDNREQPLLGKRRDAELPLNARVVTGGRVMGDAWLPEPTPEAAPFFDGANAGKLRLQCCATCNKWTFPLKERCQHCGATELESALHGLAKSRRALLAEA